MNQESMPSNANRRRFLSVAEAANELGLSEMTLYRLIQAKAFPAVKVGRRLFVPSQVLDDAHDKAVVTGRVVDTATLAVEQAAG